MPQSVFFAEFMWRHMVHVTTNSQPLIIMKVEAQSIKQFNRPLSVMVIANGIVSFKTGCTEVVEQSHDATTFVRKVGCKGSHCPINAQRMFCQSSLEAMVVMAAGCEIITMFQIGNYVAHSISVDITQQTDDFGFR